MGNNLQPIQTANGEDSGSLPQASSKIVQKQDDEEGNNEKYDAMGGAARKAFELFGQLTAQLIGSHSQSGELVKQPDAQEKQRLLQLEKSKLQGSTVRVHISPERYIEIKIVDKAEVAACESLQLEQAEAHNGNPTSGWLFQKVAKAFSSLLASEPELSALGRPIALCAMSYQSEMECIDYFLTVDSQPLASFLSAPQTGGRVTQDLQIVYQSNDTQVRPPHLPPALSEYELIKVLGTGGFSQVLMVRKKSSGRLFAMKVISKKHILDQDKVDQIISERKILTTAASEHPFIVQLHCAFTSRNNLYLVLDLCPGGELFSYIAGSSSNQRPRITESQAKICFAELLIALEHLHSQNVVYRDLKPENVLVDVEGHVRLADFGLSKMEIGEDDLTSTFCGSPEYMAPEMLMRQGHGHALDFYQLGALLYELLTGLPPFYSQNRMKMYQDIMTADRETQLRFPGRVSKVAEDLMRKMLEREPSRRLSKSQEIKSHPFLRDIDWDKLYRRELSPPLKVNYFQSNFDPEYTSMEVTIDPELEDYDLNEIQAVTNRVQRRTKSLTHIELVYLETDEVAEAMECDYEEPFLKAQELDTLQVENVLISKKSTNESTNPYSNAGLPAWQHVIDGRTMTPTFQEFIYKGKRSTRFRAESFRNIQKAASTNGARGTMLSASKKVAPPAFDADNLIVESIIEGDEVVLTLEDSHHHDVNVEVIRQDQQLMSHAYLQFRDQMYHRGQNVAASVVNEVPESNDSLKSTFIHLSESTRRNYAGPSMRMPTARGGESTMRVDTAQSAENSPRKTKDHMLVQMNIEENFNWTKELSQLSKNSPESHRLKSARDLQNFGAGSGSKRNSNQLLYRDSLGLIKCPTLRKRVTLFNPKDQNGDLTNRDGQGASFEATVQQQLNLHRKISAAQLISFTEKAGGIVSERNRDQSNMIKQDEDTEDLECEENVAPTNRYKTEVPYSQVSRISEKFEGDASSGSEKHAVSSSILSMDSLRVRPTTTLPRKDHVSHEEDHKEESLVLPKTSLKKRTPNDSFLGAQATLNSKEVRRSTQSKGPHSHNSSISIGGYSSKMMLSISKSKDDPAGLLLRNFTSQQSDEHPQQADLLRLPIGHTMKDQADYQIKDEDKGIFSLRSDSLKSFSLYSSAQISLTSSKAKLGLTQQQLCIKTNQESLELLEQYNVYQSSHYLNNPPSRNLQAKKTSEQHQFEHISIHDHSIDHEEATHHVQLRTVVTPECAQILAGEITAAADGKDNEENSLFKPFKTLYQGFSNHYRTNNAKSEKKQKVQQCGDTQRPLSRLVNEKRDMSVSEVKKRPTNLNLFDQEYFQGKSKDEGIVAVEEKKESVGSGPYKVMLSPRSKAKPFKMMNNTISQSGTGGHLFSRHPQTAIKDHHMSRGNKLAVTFENKNTSMQSRSAIKVGQKGVYNNYGKQSMNHSKLIQPLSTQGQHFGSHKQSLGLQTDRPGVNEKRITIGQGKFYERTSSQACSVRSLSRPSKGTKADITSQYHQRLTETKKQHETFSLNPSTKNLFDSQQSKEHLHAPLSDDKVVPGQSGGFLRDIKNHQPIHSTAHSNAVSARRGFDMIKDKYHSTLIGAPSIKQTIVLNSIHATNAQLIPSNAQGLDRALNLVRNSVGYDSSLPSSNYNFEQYQIPETLVVPGSGINTMQSSITEFDVENIEDLRNIRESVTSHPDCFDQIKQVTAVPYLSQNYMVSESDSCNNTKLRLERNQSNHVYIQLGSDNSGLQSPTKISSKFILGDQITPISQTEAKCTKVKNYNATFGSSNRNTVDRLSKLTGDEFMNYVVASSSTRKAMAKKNSTLLPKDVQLLPTKIMKDNRQNESHLSSLSLDQQSCSPVKKQVVPPSATYRGEITLQVVDPVRRQPEILISDPRNHQSESNTLMRQRSPDVTTSGALTIKIDQFHSPASQIQSPSKGSGDPGSASYIVQMQQKLSQLKSIALFQSNQPQVAQIELSANIRIQSTAKKGKNFSSNSKPSCQKVAHGTPLSQQRQQIGVTYSITKSK